MSTIEDFFRDIDGRWKSLEESRIRLELFGCAALMLQADYSRGTKDSDVLETAAMDAPMKKRLLELAGKDTALHRRHRLYVDIVTRGLPFLPQPDRTVPKRRERLRNGCSSARRASPVHQESESG